MLKRLIRANPKDDGETEPNTAILCQVPSYLDKEEVFVHDAGVSITDVQTAKIPRFVTRLPVKYTSRRNHLPPQNKRGRPAQYGQIVRPLPRQRIDNLISATDPDETICFQFDGRPLEAQGWVGVVRTDQKASATHETFTFWVFHDPLYKKPLVLGTNLSAQAETIF